MPFQSQAQWRWAFATDQEFADRWAKMTPGGKRRFQLLAKRKRTTTKHLPGKHDQAGHGRKGPAGSASRGAYTAARAAGSSHREALDAGKRASAEVRAQMPKNQSIASDYTKEELQQAISHSTGRVASLQQQRTELQAKLKKEQELIAQGGKLPKQLYSTADTLRGVEADLVRAQNDVTEWRQLKPKKREEAQAQEVNPLRISDRTTWNPELRQQMNAITSQYAAAQQPLPKNRKSPKFERVQMENARADAALSRQAENLFIQEHAARNPAYANDAGYQTQVNTVRALQQQREENLTNPYNSGNTLVAGTNIVRNLQRELNALLQYRPTKTRKDFTITQLIARLKHMPGKHDQSAHGKPGRVGSAFRGAYSAARAGGASHVEARNQAKTAAEQVREQIRAERREQLAANPKPKRTAPPRAETPGTTKWQAFLDKSKAEFAAAQDAYQAAMNDKNATTESLTAAQRARDAAGEKWTRDQHTANQMAAVESAPPPPRAETPAAPITRQSELSKTMASGVMERRANDARLAQIQQEMTKYITPDSPYHSDDPEYQKLRTERAVLRSRNTDLEADYDKQLAELQKLQAQPRTSETPAPRVTTPATPITPAITRTGSDLVRQRDMARQRELDARARLAKVKLSHGKGIASDNSLLLAKQDYEREQALRKKLDADIKQSGLTTTPAPPASRIDTPAPRVTTPTTPTTPTTAASKRAQIDAETLAKYDRIRARAERRIETGIDERTGKKLTRQVRAQEEANLRAYEEATGETIPYLQRIRDMIAPEITTTRLGGSRPDAIPKTREITSRISETDRTITATNDRRNAARQRELDARARLAKIRLSNGKGIASNNSLLLAEQDYRREQTARLKLDDELKQLDKDRKAQARELAQAEREVRNTIKADDSVGGIPRKYGARAGEVITGNLGRDTGGKFTRVGSNEGAIVRAAINRGVASAGGAKRAAVSDAQKRRQQADTGASSMDTLGFDASDYDFIAGDKPQDASDPQFARLIEQGLMDNVDGQAYPSALGRKIAAAAGAGDIDKAQELLARDRAKRTERQAKMDAQIQAYDDIISDETASPRARAIAARKRTILIGKSDTSTKEHVMFGTLIARLKHMPGKHDQSSHGKPGRVGSAFRGAYSAARAEGKTHREAHNEAKTAAEQVRSQMRAERREQAAANPKPKRTAPPRAETPTAPTNTENTASPIAPNMSLEQINARMREVFDKKEQLNEQLKRETDPIARQAIESQIATLRNQQTELRAMRESSPEQQQARQQTQQAEQAKIDQKRADAKQAAIAKNRQTRAITERIKREEEERKIADAERNRILDEKTRARELERDARIAEANRKFNEEQIAKKKREEEKRLIEDNETINRHNIRLAETAAELDMIGARTDAESRKRIVQLEKERLEIAKRYSEPWAIAQQRTARWLEDNDYFDIEPESLISQILRTNGIPVNAKPKRSITTKADNSYTPPAGVQAQAKRGLELRSEFGRGGTPVGIARARDLSNGKSVSRDTIMRMVSFFARHAVDKRPGWSDPSKPSNGYIAHLLWGGDAGRTWANSIAKRIKANE